jgi:hypothetical protein
MQYVESSLYRRAFSIARELDEAADPDRPGRWRRHAAGGGDAGRILAEVVGCLDAATEETLAVVRDAVGDALAWRRPRW